MTKTTMIQSSGVTGRPDVTGCWSAQMGTLVFPGCQGAPTGEAPAPGPPAAAHARDGLIGDRAGRRLALGASVGERRAGLRPRLGARRHACDVCALDTGGP